MRGHHTEEIADRDPIGYPPSARDLARAYDRWLGEIRADAWDEGHKTRWRRGPDDCHCAAWSSSECACGKYGIGELLSIHDNPYRARKEVTE